jgi:hypothetical protein
MSKYLSQYLENGFCVIPNAIAPELIERVNYSIDRFNPTNI